LGEFGFHGTDWESVPNYWTAGFNFVFVLLNLTARSLVPTPLDAGIFSITLLRVQQRIPPENISNLVPWWSLGFRL
jgi:hypothetical protein